MRYEFHADAHAEFLEAIARYESEVPDLGARFLTETERCIDLLLDAPYVGTSLGYDLQSFPLNGSFPFLFIDAVRRETLFVLAVADQS